MLIAAARRRVAALRQPEPAAHIARALWIAWAVIVWNVIFDHAIVVASRSYIVAAGLAARAVPLAHVNMDDWMRPAVTRGFWIATAAGAAVLVTGLTAVNYAGRRSERSTEPLAPRRPPSTAPSATIERLAMPDKPR